MSEQDDRLSLRTPAAELLGREVIVINPIEGEVRLRFKARPEFANRHGSVQGGLLTAMLDSTLGCAVISTLPADESTVTLEMKVSYLRPAPITSIDAVGRVIHRGRSIAYAAGELRDPDGALLATATGTFRVVREGPA